MIANGTIPAKYTLGISTEDIIDGDDGYVTEFGLVRGINTTGSLYGETWVDGDILWVSPTIEGGMTKFEPQSPYLKIEIAIVVRAHSNGSLFVRPNRYPYMYDIQQVNYSAGTETNYDILQWSGSSWNKTNTPFFNGLTATTISATTYYNLPPLYQLTGGTYSAGTIDFTNTTGGTSFSVTGLSKYFVTGSTPTGISLNNGDRWFDTNSGIEVVWITDVDGSQWIQPIQGNSTPSITGSGTTNKVAKWSNSSGLTNSIISDDGATVTVSGNQKITSGLTYQFNSLVSGDSSGEFLYFDIASTTSQSSLYYYNSSGGWTITDSSSPSSSTGLVAIANNTSPSNDGMLIRGYHKLSYSPGFSTGDKLYISNTTPGQLTNTAPTTTGYVVRIVGYVVDSGMNLIYFCPDNTWIEIV
jgi:hypothetical protein